MKTHILQLTCLTLATALFTSQNGLSATIYQWTDEEGIVHFSDAPPKGNESLEIQEMEYITFANENADPDEYSIINQLERMTEWRRQTEDERMARKQMQLEETRLAQERNSYRLNAGLNTQVYYPATYYYPYQGHFGGYNKGHGNFWPGHFGPGKGKHGGLSKGAAPNYKLDNYKFGNF